MSEIVIKNLNDNEIVKHKLILIKGFIFVNNDLLDCDGTIELFHGEKNSVWPISRGRFKCVAELKVGENRLQLKFQNARKTLKVVLKFGQTSLKVTPLYVVCKGDDGRFQAPSESDNSISSACRRISLGLHLIQIVFSEKLKEHGFRKCFQLESDLDDVPLCRVFNSTLTVGEARSMDESELWEYLAREIMCSQLGNEETKFLAFLSCTYWNGESIAANPALGGGGLALLGSACLHTWPEDLSKLLNALNDDNKIDPSLFDNSCFRGTYGGCYNTSLGSACHELGHLFNLGHSPSGIMSRGFDHVGKIFLNTNEACDDNLKLVPYLNEEFKRSKVTISNRLKLKEDDKTHFTKSCATILAHHRWFNDDSNINDIHYDSVRNILSSDTGLKVVQIRTSCGAVIKSWELSLKAPHRHFILPRYNTNATLLFAMDINGNMLSHHLQHNL